MVLSKFLLYSFEVVTYLFLCLINRLFVCVYVVCVCVCVLVVALPRFDLSCKCGRFDVQALKNGCSATHRRTSHTKTKLTV